MEHRVEMSDFGLATFGLGFNSQPWYFPVISEIGDRISWVNFLGYKHHLGQLSLASLRVAKLSTSFGCWGKGGKVTAAECQLTLCDSIWHVISHSGVMISITTSNFIFVYFHRNGRRSVKYIKFTLSSVGVQWKKLKHKMIPNTFIDIYFTYRVYTTRSQKG